MDWNRTLAASGIAALSSVLEWGLHVWVGDQGPFLFVVPAVAWSAAYLGRRPAMLVTAVGVANGMLLLRADAHLATVGAFLWVAGLIVFYVGRLRAMTDRAALTEQHLKLAQEATGIGVYDLDFVNNTAYISPSLRRTLGRPGDEESLPLDRWLGELQADHVSETRQMLNDHIERGELRYEREHRVPLAGGRHRWLLSRVQVELNAAGKLASARGATVDITQRKEIDEQLQRTERELKQQIAEMRSLQALTHDLMGAGEALSDAMQLVLERVLTFNDSVHGTLGLRRGAGSSFAAVAVQGLDPQVAQELQRTPWEAEDRAATAAAVARQAGFRSVRSFPMTDSAGETIGLLTVLFPDAHEWSESEVRLSDLCAAIAAALVERESARSIAADLGKRFAVALESASMAFMILAPVRAAGGRVVDMRFGYVNPSAARIFGRDGADLMGRLATEWSTGIWRSPQLLGNLTRVVDEGCACEFETQLAGLADLWVQVTASPLLGTAAVWFADITERKREQQLREEADRRKDEFLATLAHELRNPLAPIRQSIRIVRSTSASDAQKRWSHDVIERQVQHMALLLDDLLDVSRISRGTLLLRKCATPLNAVIDSAAEVARPHVDAKRHQLDVQLPAAAVMLEVDAMRLAQVIGNLLTNAAKYTDPGGTLRLRAEVDGTDLSVRVIDNGIGLAAEHLAQVFEMFSQAPSALARSQGGLGIGLSLARSLVRLHGGDLIGASDGPGRGSEFVLTLPGAVLPYAPPAAPGPVEDGAAPRPRRVLIADDNADAADSLAELLRMEGHDVRVAYDGEQALALFAEHAPHAALLDVGMPKLTGHEVARAVRRLPRGEDVTMIAITGWGQSRDRLEALAAGFDHHTTKPVDPDAILRLIAAARPVGRPER